MSKTEILTKLLKEAAEAHHAYEATLGHPDEDWPIWYAQFITNKGFEVEAKNGATL